MSKTLDEVMERLSPERRARGEALGHQLIREHATLKALRQQLEFTQEGMAERLEIRQATVSKLQNRGDMLISTLRGDVEALGGTLELVAHMPGHAPVTLEGFSEAPTLRKIHR